jgi:hypothetical protein
VDESTKNQLGENMRFYGDMRFKQLTLLLTGLTLAGAGVAQYSDKPFVGSLDVRSALAVVSMVFTSVMWILEVRSTLYFVAALQLAPDLWPCPLAVRLSWLNATNGVLVLHLFIYLGWYWCAWQWYPSCFVRVAFGVLGLLLLLFSILNYVPLWKHR